MRAAAARGLLGVTIPQAWGGAGPRLLSYVARHRGDRAGERDGGRVAGRAPTRSSPSSSPTPGGRRRKNSGCGGWRPGEAIGAFALSEPDAGTDAANQQTRAVQTRRRLPDHRPQGVGRQRRGRVGRDRLRLHAARACAARASPRFSCRWTRPASRARRAPTRSAFAAWAAWISISTSTSATSRCSARSIRDSGSRCGRSQGGRVAIAAQALGIGEAALAEAIAYAKQRAAFGQPIAQLPGDSVDAGRHGHRARGGADADAGRRRPRRIARSASRFEASMAKLAASEAAHKAADKAMQILASAGYRRGSVVERLVPRRARDGDLSGHVRSAADDHRRGCASPTA